jgi:CHAT domain-containing protein
MVPLMNSMINRFAIAPLAFGLWFGQAVVLSSGESRFSTVAWAQDCTPGRDCEQQLYRGILRDYAQELAAAQGDRAKQVEVMRRAGEAHQYLGDFSAAIALYQKALPLARQAKDRRGEADVLSNLTTAYNKQTPPDGGMVFLEQELQRVQGDRDSLKIVLETLGSISINLGNYQKTLEAYQRYIQLVRQDRDAVAEASALWNSAIALGYLGNFPGAVAAMETAVTLQLQRPEVEPANLYLAQLAELYLKTDAIDQAGRTYDRIIKRSLDHPVWMLQGYEGLATAFAAIKNLDAAQDVLTAMVDLADALRPGSRTILKRDALDRLSLTYAWQGNYAKAIATQQTIAQVTGDPALISQDYLGAFYLRSGKFKAAETALKQAIALYTRSRESLSEQSSNLSPNNFDTDLRGNFDLANTSYRNLEAALVAQNRLGEALEIAEEGRAKAHLALLAQRLGVTPDVQANQPSITLERIKQVAKVQNTTLVEYSILYSDITGLRQSGSPFRYGTAQPTPTTLHIWVVQPNGAVTLRTVDLRQALKDQPLEQLVRTTRQSLGVRGRSAALPIRTPDEPIATAANPSAPPPDRLYELLIAPIADLLPTDPSQSVTIIPQDELFLVSFAAIQQPNRGYLIEHHTLLTAPSIQILELTHSLKTQRRTGQPATGGQPPTATPNALVVGNPQMPSLRLDLNQPPQPLTPLTGAKAEAEAIAQLLNVAPLSGGQASETVVKAQLSQARVIHFATHGILDNLQGLQSALAFAPSDRDDGFLTAKELLKYKLTADLVVLSACDTGRGSISGDGVLGLSRSFISAGAPSLVVSLWAIPDAATATLMTHFYKNLQTQPNKAIALRQAMLATMQAYPDPLHWAAFTLMGEAL